MAVALARRLSIKMTFAYAQMRSRSTPAVPNAFPIRSNALSLDENSVSSVDHAFGPTGVERERIRAASARRKQCSQLQQCIWTDRRRARAHPSSFRSTKTVFPASTMHAFKKVTKKLTTELSLAERSEAHRAKRGAARSAAAAEGGRRRRRPRAARGLQSQARMRPN